MLWGHSPPTAYCGVRTDATGSGPGFPIHQAQPKKDSNFWLLLAAAMNNAFFGDGQAKGNLGEMPSVGRRDTVPRRHSGEPEKCGQPAL
jgi:hypothetical protein